MRRVVFQEWIVALGRDPAEMSRPSPDRSEETADPGSRIIGEQVQRALSCLPEIEREFLERYYLMGQGYADMIRRTGRSRHKLESLHRRAARRLKKELAGFVRDRFGLGPRLNPDCPICKSRFRAEIDRLIAAKNPTHTWRGIIRTLRTRYNIRVATPQVVIGHAQYHERTEIEEEGMSCPKKRSS